MISEKKLVQLFIVTLVSLLSIHCSKVFKAAAKLPSSLSQSILTIALQKHITTPQNSQDVMVETSSNLQQYSLEEKKQFSETAEHALYYYQLKDSKQGCNISSCHGENYLGTTLRPHVNTSCRKCHFTYPHEPNISPIAQTTSETNNAFQTHAKMFFSDQQKPEAKKECSLCHGKDFTGSRIAELNEQLAVNDKLKLSREHTQSIREKTN